MDFTVEEAAIACRGKLHAANGAVSGNIPRICHDTRELGPGDFFIALKGQRADGHSMLGDAFAKGAAGAVVSRTGPGMPDFQALIVVEDTLRALGDMAASYRRRFDIPVVGITGSSGKTTVREMLSSILSLEFRVLKPEKNFNNHIGLPLTLLRLDRMHSACVLEMGMSAPGEISFLCGAAAPGTGIITNVGLSHLGNFCSRDGIASAKAEILPGLSRAVLNADDYYFEFFRERAAGEIRTFGSGRTADFRAENPSPRGTGWKFFLNGRVEAFLPARGRHNLSNALAAAAAASFLGMDEEACAEGLARYSPPPMRLEEKFAGGVRIIDDTYNASPESVSAAAEAVSGIEGRKIFVLGDMLELGASSKRCHEEAGRAVAGRNVDVLFTFGVDSEHAARAAEGAGACRARHFTSRKALADRLLGELSPGDVLVVKGSRAMGMEKIVCELETGLGEARGE